MANVLQRVPKWAWYVTGGVAIGGAALKFANNRRASDDQEAASTGTDPSTGQPVGTAPPGVIVPPVIMGGGGGDGGGGVDPNAAIALYTNLGDIFGTGFSRVLDTADRMAWSPDQVVSLLGNAGASPNPVQQEPTVVNVTLPAPPPYNPAPAAPAKGFCPPGFPQGTPPNCFKDCQHTECGSNHRKRINMGHCYQDGHRVHMGNQQLADRC